MVGQNKEPWKTIVTLSIAIPLGVGAGIWMTPHSPAPEARRAVASQQDQRLERIEQAVTSLTHSLQVEREQTPTLEVASIPTSTNDDASRQELVQLIRNELRQALANQSPEAQRAREEAIVEADILNSPENREAYQSALSVVRTAVAAKRWTEEDKEDFRAAFIQLTNDQRTELMQILAPAINNGGIKVEVTGPLF